MESEQLLSREGVFHGINGLRTPCPSCGHHAEGFAQAVAGGQIILRAVRRCTRSCFRPKTDQTE